MHSLAARKLALYCWWITAWFTVPIHQVRNPVIETSTKSWLARQGSGSLQQKRDFEKTEGCRGRPWAGKQKVPWHRVNTSTAPARARQTQRLTSFCALFFLALVKKAPRKNKQKEICMLLYVVQVHYGNLRFCKWSYGSVQTNKSSFVKVGRLRHRKLPSGSDQGWRLSI